MPLGDLWGLLVETLRTQRLRAFLTTLGIVIGIASVVLLSSIGEGTRRGIADQFAQFGTTVIGVNPGRVKTFGVSPGAIGGTTHPLTVEDGLALRRVAGVRYVAPHLAGTAEVEAGGRARRTMIYGTVHEDQYCLQWYPRLGTFLPAGDPESIAPVCVLGATVARELFPHANPLGAHARIGEARFRVVGVMGSKGQMMGIDLDDMVYIPVVRALRLFNLVGVQEVHVLAASHDRIEAVSEGVRRVLMERHDGEEDFTITTQADMLAVVNEVLDVLTAGVLAIAGIAVFVGAMGILTITWVSVHERTSEIGLVKALGASDRQVATIFLAEAATLSVLGGAAGLALGVGGGGLIAWAWPALWIRTPAWIVPVAMGVSLGVGLLAGVAPALRAARMDPIEALRAE